MSFRAEAGVALVGEMISKDSWLKCQYPRLARAYADISSTSQRGIDKAIKRASQLQVEIAGGFPEEGVGFRRIELAQVSMLHRFIRENDGAVIVMRHGKQLLENEPDSIQGAQRKIVMMREVHNLNDPAEGQSLVEASAFAMILYAISQELHLPVNVRASENLRAIEVAAPSAFFTRFRVRVDPRLSCVNYSEGLDGDDINRILGEGSSGALTWEKDKVDGVCGEGTFDRMTCDMTNLVSGLRCERAITLLSTHTPQMNAVDVFVGAPTARVPELGFRIVGKTESRLFSNSIFFHSV